MTHTQANEPGFVLVPREPTEAMLDAAHEIAISCFEGDETCFMSDNETESVFHAMLAAAPIVPAPAYEVKADEIAKLVWEAMQWGVGAARPYHGFPDWMEGGNSLAQEKARDFERRILSCLSSAPVEEADAKAWEKCADCGGTGLALNMAGEPDECRECNGNTVVPTIPSEPEAKGEAGAGPVGEAVAQKLFEAFAVPRGNVHGVWADYGEEGKAMFSEVASHFLASIARPVDEPGEVERLTRERDEAVQNAQDLALDLASAYEKNADAVSREAALAETRERLEKVGQSPAIDGLSLAVVKALVDLFGGEETDMTVQFIKDGHSGSGFYAWCTEYPEDGSEYLGSASEFSHRAALTGDAQEGGK